MKWFISFAYWYLFWHHLIQNAYFIQGAVKARCVKLFQSHSFYFPPSSFNPFYFCCLYSYSFQCVVFDLNGFTMRNNNFNVFLLVWSKIIKEYKAWYELILMKLQRISFRMQECMIQKFWFIKIKMWFLKWLTFRFLNLA